MWGRILDTIRQDLVTQADVQVREKGQRFFKEKVKSYGVKTSVVTSIAKGVLPFLREASKKEVFVLCEELWRSGYIEEGFIACEWVYAQRDQYAPDDFYIFDSWIDRYISNWATCDTLCNHSIGSFVVRYPVFIKNLKEWTASDNRWKRRAAAVTLIISARNGLFLDDIFRISDCLLQDKEDLVQKGYGWMLKAASEAHQQEVFSYLLEKRSVMPRTAFRYALEKMPKDMRAEAMKK